MWSLELKIPPPAVALIVAVTMWTISLPGEPLAVPAVVRAAVAGIVALVGGAFSASGVISFRRAKTTVNPKKPQAASSLVTSGVYRLTRNPMYVGLLFVLVAWAIFLSSAWTLVGPPAFLLYITRFQIQPEERVLAAMFGTAYSNYKENVRRWL